MNGPGFWNELLTSARNTWNIRGMVAGGAVRDWMLGIQPNDIDLFLPHGRAANRAHHPEGWEFRRDLTAEEYAGAGHDFNVQEYLVRDTIVQVMFLRHGFHTHYAGFDNNLTKGYYEPQGTFNTGRLKLSDDLLYGMEHQVIYPMHIDHAENVRQRMNEQRERLNRTIPGWRIENANPFTLQRVQQERRADPGAPGAGQVNEIQVRAQPVFLNGAQAQRVDVGPVVVGDFHVDFP